MNLFVLSVAGMTATLLSAPSLADGDHVQGLALDAEAPASTAPPVETSSIGIATDSAFRPKPGPTRVARSPDGLFYVHARVNGTLVRFVVDTGATATVLSSEDMARVGITPDPAATGRLATVAGSAAMRWAPVDRIEIAGHRIGAIDAVVPDAPLPSSLLGQDVLARLGGLTLEGDWLTIR